MDKMALLQRVSEEACRFLYYHYELDEIANGKDTVLYCDGDTLVLAIHIREDRFDFVIPLGDAERHMLETERGGFPPGMMGAYDEMKAWNDGKWIEVPVADLQMLEGVKRLLLRKKKPNRTPFPKESAVYSKCGMRCDLCVHYTGGTISDSFREELKRRVGSVFGYEDYSENMALCPGCLNKESDACRQIEHARSKGLASCLACEAYPCAQCGLLNISLQATRSTCAKTLTWAILPYVGGLNH